MARCFGNSAYDRHLESELNRHLESELNRHLDFESTYDSYVEKVLNCIEAGREDLDDFLNSSKCDEVLQHYYPTDNVVLVAEKIKDEFLGLSWK